MHFVIMGCGRVGAMLATSLDERGHSVVVVDQDAAAFARLDRSFEGETVAGLGFDRTILERARIREAAGFAAVSSGDNSNVIAARVVREEFGVRRVVARIYDPHRAEVYERLGIATVPTVRWAAAQVMGRLLPGAPEHQYRDVSGALTMIAAQPHPSWIGTPLTRVEKETGSRIAHLTRYGEGILPKADAHLQDGDRLHLLVPTAQLEQVETQLAHQRDEDDVRESFDRALRGEKE